MEKTRNSISSSDETEVREAFRMISYLLQYPVKRWLQWMELMEVANLYENLKIKEPLIAFLNMIGESSLDDLKEQYVSLFDFNSACSLYLTYLKIGDQRERGQILAELKELYRNHGFLMTDEELSDYLPLVLEFSAVAPLQVSVNLLTSMREPIEKLKSELNNLNSPYVYLIDACLSGCDVLKKITLIGKG
ncbi:nitrate reductase molybdenum cofactor assembly chaperone [Bacillus sp. V3-13]|uniref:nitrate reductase molybdenum cofactor assembly chaperone n=1 Tax=Bacillus sp. V3-13 TaxID=2053728 RepID=UPI0015E11316|nr:nitrate reductase molybdenum cofactor assembly chaperone [Bacillus sp. V3-13]